jgi:hypothetical protein
MEMLTIYLFGLLSGWLLAFAVVRHCARRGILPLQK